MHQGLYYTRNSPSPPQIILYLNIVVATPLTADYLKFDPGQGSQSEPTCHFHLFEVHFNCLPWHLQGSPESPLLLLLVPIDLRHAGMYKRQKADWRQGLEQCRFQEQALWGSCLWVTHASVSNHNELISSLSWAWMESFLCLACAFAAGNAVSLCLPRKGNAIPSYLLVPQFL